MLLNSVMSSLALIAAISFAAIFLMALIGYRLCSAACSEPPDFKQVRLSYLFNYVLWLLFIFYLFLSGNYENSLWLTLFVVLLTAIAITDGIFQLVYTPFVGVLAFAAVMIAMESSVVDGISYETRINYFLAISFWFVLCICNKAQQADDFTLLAISIVAASIGMIPLVAFYVIFILSTIVLNLLLCKENNEFLIAYIPVMLFSFVLSMITYQLIS